MFDGDEYDARGKVNKIMKNLTMSILKLFIFILFIVASVILATSKFDNPLGIRSFVVLTGSMQPKISVGSLIFTKNSPNYIVGDIIAYKQGNVTVTHRIVGTEQKNAEIVFKTKGDANKVADKSTVGESSIYGKETLSIPYLGNVIFFMRSPAGFIISIIIPAILFIAFEFATIKKEMEKEFQKKYQST